MSAAVVLAGAGGACAVAATWEILASVERTTPVAAAERLLGPFRRPGTIASADEHRRLGRTAAMVLLGAGWLFAGPLVGIGLAAGAPWLVRRALAARRSRWRAGAAAAAPTVARALADALAGGHSVRGALVQASRYGGITGPAADVLAIAVRGLAAGDRTDAVLERMRTTVRDPGWNTLVAAILLARDTGGDLAALLRSLAGAGEQARRDEADARAATAQARLTAGIVTALPLGAAVLAELADPGMFAELLTDPRSASLLALALAAQAGALVAVRRIARIGQG